MIWPRFVLLLLVIFALFSWSVAWDRISNKYEADPTEGGRYADPEDEKWWPR